MCVFFSEIALVFCVARALLPVFQEGLIIAKE